MGIFWRSENNAAPLVPLCSDAPIRRVCPVVPVHSGVRVTQISRLENPAAVR